MRRINIIGLVFLCSGLTIGVRSPVSQTVSPSKGRLQSLNLQFSQAQALQIGGIAQRTFGSRYAGTWVDREKVQIVIGVSDFRTADSQTGFRIFKELGVVGSVVGVSYSQAQLQKVSGWIQDRLPQANQGAVVPINIGQKTDANEIEITTPPSGLITWRQKALATEAVDRWSRLIRVYVSRAQPTVLPCRGVFCDPPLRSGIATYTDLMGCSAGFMARSRSDGKLYQLIAGHCRGAANYNWLTEFTNTTVHSIGPMHNYRFSKEGDVGIVRVDNPAGWRARAWVVIRGTDGLISRIDYPIRADRDGVVGARVCIAGAAGHAIQCGQIVQTNVTVTYLKPRVTVSGLFQTTACAYQGDSGAPMFSDNVAYGIVSGGTVADSGAGCISFGQPIVEAENLMRVNIAHDAG